MATYKITNNQTGETIRVSGNKPPTQAEVAEIFSSRQTAEPEDTRTGFQKATDFAGLKSTIGNIGALGFFGQGGRTDQAGQASSEAFKQAQQLTQLAKKETNAKKKKQLLDQARAIMEGSAQEMDTFQQDLSKRQDVARISEKEIERGPEQFAARRALGQSAELAALLMPFTKEARAAQAALKLGTAGQRIAQAGKVGATVGGLQGLAGSTREADTLAEAGIRTAGGAAIGGATGAVMQGVFEGGKWMFDKLKDSARQKAIDAYKNTLKQNVRDKKFYKQYGGEEKVVKDSVKYKVANTKNGVNNQLERYKPEYERIILEEANKLEKAGTKIDIAKLYENAQKRVKDKLGYDEALLKQANKWFEDNAQKYANQTSAKAISANRLRSNLDQKVGQILTPDAYGQDAARKAFATELRMAFKEKAGSKAKDAIQKYHLLSGLTEAMQKEPKFGLTEAALAGASPGTGLINLVELLLGKAVRSPGLRRSLSQQAMNISAKPATGVNLPVSLGINPLTSYLQNEIGK